MPTVVLKQARVAAGFSQQEVALRLGVSQPYYSQMERGTRTAPKELLLTAVRKLRFSPLSLPLPDLSMQFSTAHPDALAESVGEFGYPGFAHVAQSRNLVNPAELVALSLAHTDLDTRLVEALPWVMLKFPELDWSWLIGQCRLLNLQNRLGFLLALADKLNPFGCETPLAEARHVLEESRLAAEGTLCRDSMPAAERSWVRKNRPPEAAHWNLLTTLTVEQLTHAR